MTIQNKTILITGTTGFIGFHLAKYLLEQTSCRVIGIDSITDYYDPKMKKARNEILKAHKNYTFYKKSISDYKVLETIIKKEKPEMIVHLAAQAGVRYSVKNPWAYVDSNYLGTLNIFEAAKRLKIRRVLFASSSSVYGKNKKMPFSETDVVDQQISLYGASKKANEVLAHSYHHLYGTEIAGLRFFTVYGEYGRPDLALFKFTKKILKGQPIDVFNEGKMSRNFTYVDDVVRGIVALLEKDQLGYEIYNLGGGETIDLGKFIELIEKNLGMKARKNMLPMQPGDVPATLADLTKAKKDLGYEPQVSIEEGIKRFTTWFIENKTWLMKLKDSE